MTSEGRPVTDTTEPATAPEPWSVWANPWNGFLVWHQPTRKYLPVVTDMAEALDHDHPATQDLHQLTPRRETGPQPTALRAGFTQTEAFRALETQITALDQRIAELREYTGTALNLQQLIMQTTLACATCLHEERAGVRQDHHVANTIIDGTAYCNEHLDDVNGRLVPRKSSGLIVAGG